MTKRIFAIVLALVMSLSILAVDVFAADSITVNADVSGTTVKAVWFTNSSATIASFSVSLYNSTGQHVNTVTKTTNEASFTGINTGNYRVVVEAKNSDGEVVATGYSGQVTVGTPSTGGSTTNPTGALYSAYFGSYHVTKYADKVVVAWTATTGATKYVVSYNGKQTVSYTASIELPIDVSTAFTIGVVAGNNTAVLKDYGVQTVPAGISGGSTTNTGSGTQTSGNLSITKNSSYSVVRWTAVSGASGYIVEYKKSSSTSYSSSYVSTNTANVPFGVNDTWEVNVKAVVGTNIVTIGSATVYPGSSNTGSSGVITSGNLVVTKGTTSSAVRWNAVTGATAYIINYKKVGASVAETTYTTATQVTLPYGANDSWIVEVRAIVSSNLVAVGSATVTPGSTNNGITNGTITTNGSNCTVVSTATSSIITWTTSGSNFLVVYTETGKDAQIKAVSSKSITIPVGYNTTFTVDIYNMSTGTTVKCASATVKASSTGGSSTVTKTEIKNLELEYSGSWNTVVSWDKVSGAQFYQIDHARLGAQAGESEVTTKNTLTLPYSKNVDFQVIVTAFMANGSKKTVGYAYHVAGTSADSDVVTPDVEVAEEFETVTGFWAETLGDGHVMLTWNAVEDADDYKVYYRKVGATKWSGGHKRTKTNITIDFGSKTSTYEFKIVAGDEESTVLTIKPNAEQGTVAWAANPDSDADFETNLYAEVLDADNGKIKFTWDSAKNVDEYKVYYRKAGTTSWKGGYERKSSLTITFKEANIDSTYEIKIVANGKDSDIFTLKPAVWANAE